MMQTAVGNLALPTFTIYDTEKQISTGTHLFTLITKCHSLIIITIIIITSKICAVYKYYTMKKLKVNLELACSSFTWTNAFTAFHTLINY